MLNIEIRKEDGTLTVYPEGMINTNTAGEFKERLNEIPDDAGKVIVDLEKLKYISSAGLRVILGLHNRIEKGGGELIFTNVNNVIREVFEDTGFSDFLTIE